MTLQQKKNKYLEELLIEKLVSDEDVIKSQLENGNNEPYDFNRYSLAKIRMDLVPPYMSLYEVLAIVNNYLDSKYTEYKNKLDTYK